MRKLVLLLLLAPCWRLSDAQQKPPVFLNHLYFVMDSSSFEHLFDSAYLQTIGDTSEVSTTTTKDSWTGKYFKGKESYFEFFSSSNFKDAAAGGVGFGFMTLKTGDISVIQDAWPRTKTDSVEKDTVTYDDHGKTNSWFYSLALYTPDSVLPVSIWLMENTPEQLHLVGFSDEEIKQPITWAEYTSKRHHKEFDKPFNRIVGVEIQLSPHDYLYLKKSLLGFGLKERKNSFSNKYITIKYSINNGTATKLQSVTFKLDGSLAPRHLSLGPNLSLAVVGDVGVLKFHP